MEEDRERVKESDRTTIVTTDGGGRGGGTTVAVVLVIVLLIILLFVVFGDRLRDTADEVAVPEDLDVNVNVAAPVIRLPDVEIRQADEPPPAQAPPANQDGNSS